MSWCTTNYRNLIADLTVAGVVIVTNVGVMELRQTSQALMIVFTVGVVLLLGIGLSTIVTPSRQQ